MSKISNLINTHCPQGVPFSPLGEVCDIKTGKLNANASVANGKYKFFTCGSKVLNINTYAFDTEALLISGNGNIGNIHYYSGKFNAYQRTYVLTTFNKVYIKFVKHYLSAFLKQHIINKEKVSCIPYIVINTLSSIKIPIPPLEVQLEIVNILDAFTKLEAELEAELEARLKQYNYYLNHLLTFSPTTTPFSPLGEVAVIKHGKDYKHLNKGLIPVYGSGGVIHYVEKYIYDKPTVLIPRKGTITNLFYLDEPFWNVDTIYYTKINNNKIIPKFLYYFLKNINLSNFNTGSGRPSLTMEILNIIPIPIPPLAKQQEIVNILDKFNTLTTDISIGLPAEIAKRKQQYTHYRNKLLTFKELPQ
jgi:type I restriction enzyme S subunit